MTSHPSEEAPATPVAVVRQLSQLTVELRDVTAAYRDAELDAARKRHHADMAEVYGFLDADGAMELRKNMGKKAADQLEGDALVAEALVKALRARLRELEIRIDVGRTYGATVRAELKTLDYGGHP